MLWESGLFRIFMESDEQFQIGLGRENGLRERSYSRWQTQRGKLVDIEFLRLDVTRKSVP
ncbi:MAG: hypothetical protein OXG24_03580 [Gammaproteobacteria bacterium]|nr:hypothetical protein [Gammaproteobacteria bacterium]